MVVNIVFMIGGVTPPFVSLDVYLLIMLEQRVRGI